jgi:hypothetical protein
MGSVDIHEFLPTLAANRGVKAGHAKIELTIGVVTPLNETKMEPEAPSTTYYLAACSEANAGMLNRTPESMNPTSVNPLSPMISVDSQLLDLAARVQLTTREILCGPVILIT